MEQVSYDEFYALMDISGVIVVEDTMEFDFSRTAIMYDYLIMTDSDRKNMITNISSRQLGEKLANIYAEYLKYKSDFVWEMVPKRDVEYYIQSKGFHDLYQAIEIITESEIVANIALFQRYGLGVKIERALGYRGLLEDSKREGRSIPLRIYMDFAATDLKNMEQDIQFFTKESKFFLCVIDNFMNGEARGKDIIDELQNNKFAKKNGICIALSSQKEDITRKTEEMYVGFVNKSAENIDEQIKKHLIMSQYKIMLSLLNKKRVYALQKSFSYAADNMEVAVFLSAMAKEEGITNHEILNQWIDLREKYYTYQDSKEEIRRIILLSSLFERIGDGESVKEVEASDIAEFQRFEQYDYNINEFMSPPLSGDIFYIKGKYYLLVGQECDLSIRNGQRKNPIAEMIPINLIKNMDMGNDKEDYNFEKLLLGKFKTIDGQTCNISIDCTKREIIDNEILDLCSLNERGESQICVGQEMDVNVKYLLPMQWHHYYNNLQDRFSSLKNKYTAIKQNEQALGFDVMQLVYDMGASHNNRLVSIVEFVVDKNTIKYDVKRVCRVRNHVLLINKLYLEYRGRQAFNTINMDVGRTALYTLEMENSGNRAEGKRATVILTTSRKENSNTKRRDWLIDKMDLLQFIKDVKPDKSSKYENLLSNLDEKLLLEDISGFIEKNAIKYTKQIKGDELLLKIRLLK